MAKKTKEYYQKTIGSRTNTLTIIDTYSKQNKIVALCRCDCGSTTEKPLSALLHGAYRSCGCIKKGGITKHSMCATAFYMLWADLKSRCSCVTNRAYKYYGGRGITYDSKWEDFLEFKKDMYFKYVYAKKKYRKEITKYNPITTERKNVNGNYCFDNCEFIPRNRQHGNTRKNKWFMGRNLATGKEYKSKNQREFSRQHNLHHRTISKVLNKHLKKHRGWIFWYI